MNINLLNFNFRVLLFCFLLSLSQISWGQIEIFNESGGGSEPAGWTFNENAGNQAINKGSYWLVEAGNPSDDIITASYNLSSYSSVEFSLNVASYGSGGHNKAKIEISYDGGVTYTQTETSTTTTGSSYIDGGTFSLNNLTSTVVLKISNNSISGRGVRLRNLKLIAEGVSNTSVINVNPNPINNLTYIENNGPSQAQSFEITGNNLDGSNVNLNLPTNSNFEISETETSGYSSNITLTNYDGTTTTLYARLKSGLTTAEYNDAITISGGSANDVVLNLNGKVIASPPTNDECTNAIALSVNTGEVTGTLENSNFEDPFDEGNAVWYSFTPTYNEAYTISLSNFSGDADLYVYNSCPTLSNPDDIYSSATTNLTETITEELISGSTYFINVTAYNTAAEDSFTIEVTAPAAPEPCIAPSDQATNLILNNVSSSSISGDFTATTADKYLALVSESSSLSQLPINGVTYSTNEILGNAIVIEASNNTTITAPNLNPFTVYYFYIFSYNDMECLNGPNYNTSLPLTNNISTTEAPEGALNLFFSEYVEGSSNNKYLEIFNGTGEAVNLAEYTVELYNNGSSFVNNVQNLDENSPSLANNEVIVLANSNATIYNGNVLESSVCNFNGDDAIVLKHNGNTIDIIGQVGCDPGSRWSSNNHSTENKTLTRKTTICQGVTSNTTTGCGFPTLESEWIVLNQNDVSNLGNHEAECSNPLSANYTYTAGAWSTEDPSGIATATDNIEILDGIASFTLDTQLNNLTIANGAVLQIEGIVNVLGDITNNGNIIFMSNAQNTAQLEEFNGNLNGSGDVSVQRYIPARRAFRLLSSPVSGQSFANSWQQDTHITGSVQGDNGFDATITGNPSMFTFNNTYTSGQNPWQAITNTTASNLETGRGYRIVVRGDRTIDLSSNNSPANNTTLKSTGILHTGSYVNSTLNTVKDKFSLVGNPYQAIVDMNTVMSNTSTNNVNTNFYYVWDPNLSEEGAYAVVDLSDGSSNVASSEANQYLQPGQAFFVTTAENGNASIGFEENNKATTNSSTNVFSYNIMTEQISVNLYTQEQFINGISTDGLKINFIDGENNGINLKDAPKFGNLNENMARNNSNKLLSIEYRDLPIEEEILQLFVNNYKSNSYTLNIEVPAFDNVNTYLKDVYLDSEILLQPNQENLIAFTVDQSIDESVDYNRFKIIFKAKVLALDNPLTSIVNIYPNPVTNGQLFIEGQFSEDDHMRVYNILGQEVLYKNLNSEKSNVNVNRLQNGSYIIKFNIRGKSITKKLIIQ